MLVKTCLIVLTSLGRLSPQLRPSPHVLVVHTFAALDSPSHAHVPPLTVLVPGWYDLPAPLRLS